MTEAFRFVDGKLGYRGAVDGAICPGGVRPGVICVWGVVCGGGLCGAGRGSSVRCALRGTVEADVRSGGVRGQGHRADQRRVGGEAGGDEFGRERGARLQGLLQARPQPLPGLDQAAAHRDPGRVHANGQVDHMECQFGDEFADQAVQPGLGVGRAEHVGGRHRLGRPAGQGLAADHVLQRDPGAEREAHVGQGAEVVADLAGRAVRARDDLAPDDQGGGQPGAQVQVDRRVVAGQRAPAHLGLGRRLGVGGHPDRRPRERGPQFASEREVPPAADGGGQVHPVLERDPEGRDAGGSEGGAGCHAVQQVAGGLHAPAETGPGAELAAAAHGGGAQPGPVQAADRNGDLGAAEVEPENDGRPEHGACLG